MPRMQLGKWVMTLCSAAACLTSAFISHFNCGCKLLHASTFCWPSFDVGRGERAGGEELARKQERKGKHGTPRGGILGSDKEHPRLVKQALRVRETNKIQYISENRKQTPAVLTVSAPLHNRKYGWAHFHIICCI